MEKEGPVSRKQEFKKNKQKKEIKKEEKIANKRVMHKIAVQTCRTQLLSSRDLIDCILKHYIRRGRENCCVHSLGQSLLYIVSAILGYTICPCYTTDMENLKIAGASTTTTQEAGYR